MKANSFRPRLIEEKSGCRINDVFSQFVPRVALRENILCQALSAVAAVGLLNCLKHQIGHMSFMIRD